LSGGNSKSFARDEFTLLSRMSEHNYCLEDSFTDESRRRS
jgi:hypothetical protein